MANTLYNLSGRIRAENFRFPYRGQAFDLILLKSVFTHLSHNSMAHYFSEIRRMLSPGAVCLATFLLLNEDARVCIRNGKSAFTFSYPAEGSWVLDRHTPDYLVAHDEVLMRNAAQCGGLTIFEPIHYGAWCGRSDYVSFQDMVLFGAEAEAHE